MAYLGILAYGAFVKYVYPHMARPIYQFLAQHRGDAWAKLIMAGSTPKSWNVFLNSTAPFIWLVGFSLLAALVDWRLSRTLSVAAEKAEALKTEALREPLQNKARLYRAAAEWSFDESEEETLMEFARQIDEETAAT